jgi:S1-C subfamily serine protease
VVDNVGAIEVTLSDGRKLPTKLVGSDPLTDLAVLKIEASNLLPVQWGDSDLVTTGSPVWAVGSPFGLQQTVTFGIISFKHRVGFNGPYGARMIPGTPYSDLMQSDVVLHPGNSGGPLVNAAGQVIGVNAAILGESFRGVSFSIPSQVAQRVAEQLIGEGEVPRAWLGVQLADLSDDEKFAEDGVPRRGVKVIGFPQQLSSPARRAGILVGDKIVTFDGFDVSGTAQLIKMIGESPVGHTIDLGVERGSEQLSFEIKLERRSAELIPR